MAEFHFSTPYILEGCAEEHSPTGTDPKPKNQNEKPSISSSQGFSGIDFSPHQSTKSTKSINQYPGHSTTPFEPPSVTHGKR